MSTELPEDNTYSKQMRLIRQEMESRLGQLPNIQVKAEEEVDTRFQLTDIRFEKVDMRIDLLQENLFHSFRQWTQYERIADKRYSAHHAEIDARFYEVNTHLTSIDIHLGEIDNHFKKVDTRIKALSQDMAGSFRQAEEYQMRTEQQIDARFNGMDARFDKMDARFDKMDARFEAMDTRFEAMDTRLDKMDTRFDRIEATMATKDDIANMATKDDIANMATKDDIANMATKDDLVRMEERILGAIKQLFMAAGISFSLPTTEITTDIEFLPPQTDEEM